MAYIEALKGRTTTKAIIILTAILLGWMVAGFISSWISRLAARNFDSHQSMLIKRFSFYLIMALAIITGLNEAGINLSVVVGAAGVASVAVGFASQTSMSNLISGIFMIIEKPFMVGDTIKVGATTGQVVSMGLLSTILKTGENIMIRIPNENLMKSEIANTTRYTVRKIDIPISVAYSANLEQVKETVLTVAKNTAGVLKDPAPQVVFKDFSDHCIHLSVGVWVNLENLADVNFSIPSQIRDAFEKAKISFPIVQPRV